MAKLGVDILSGLIHGMQTVALTIYHWVQSYVYRPIVDFFVAAVTWLPAHGADTLIGFLRGALSISRSINPWFNSNVRQPVLGFFAGAFSWLVHAGSDLIGGLVNGATSALSAIGSWASKVYDAVVGAIKSIFGIKSPSTVFHTLGGHMMQGLMNGLLSGQSILDSVVKKVFSSPLDAAKALIKKGFNLVSIGGKDILSFFSSLGGDILSMLGLSSKGGNTGASSASAATAQAYAASQLGSYGWGSDQMAPLLKLWNQESGWNSYAVNPSSGAAGIAQSLGHGAVTLGDYQGQINWGLGYIRSVYGDPANAWAHEVAYNWYDSGGWLPPGLSLAMNGTGRPERILSHQDAANRQGGDLHVHLHNDGVIGSQRELNDWLVASLQDLKRNGRLRGLVG
jgi:hypothetical protein